MQQVLRTESLLESLSELKAIEDQRLADEYASVIRTRELAERRQRDAELAAVAAEQERIATANAAAEELARARADAEREVWQRVEAADAEERARTAAALEAQRLDFERELRRQLARQLRPRSLMVMTAVSLVVAAIAGGIAISKQGAITSANDATAAADRDIRTAAVLLAGTMQRFDRFELDLAAVAHKLEGAVDRVVIAQREANVRAAAQAQYDRDKAVWKRHQDDLDRKAKQAKRDRDNGVTLSAECINQGVCQEVLRPNVPRKK